MFRNILNNLGTINKESAIVAAFTQDNFGFSNLFLKFLIIPLFFSLIFKDSIVYCSGETTNNINNVVQNSNDSKFWVGLTIAVTVIGLFGGYWQHVSGKNSYSSTTKGVKSPDAQEVDNINTLVENCSQPWLGTFINFNSHSWTAWLGSNAYHYVTTPMLTLVKFLAMHKIGLTAACVCIGTAYAPGVFHFLKPHVQGYINKISKVLLGNYLGWNILNFSLSPDAQWSGYDSSNFFYSEAEPNEASRWSLWPLKKWSNINVDEKSRTFEIFREVSFDLVRSKNRRLGYEAKDLGDFEQAFLDEFVLSQLQKRFDFKEDSEPLSETQWVFGAIQVCALRRIYFYFDNRPSDMILMYPSIEKFLNDTSNRFIILGIIKQVNVYFPEKGQKSFSESSTFNFWSSVLRNVYKIKK